MSAVDLVLELAKEETAPEFFPGEVIAEFANGHDARDFAKLKRAQGTNVTVTPGINLTFAVRPWRKVS